MATERDLKKASRENLTPFMVSLGYKEGSGCSYYKVVGDGVFHVLMVVPIFSGKQARVWINCTVPELVEGFGTQKFPPDGMTIQLGGYMSDKGIGYDYARSLIDTDDRRVAFMKSLIGTFERHAFPLFDRILCRQQFCDSMSVEKRAHYERIGMIDRILHGDSRVDSV